MSVYLPGDRKLKALWELVFHCGSAVAQPEPMLMATVYSTFGAARALPGRSVTFNLAPHLLDATIADVEILRAAQWTQDVDGDFLMDCVLALDGSNAEITKFLEDMTELSVAGFGEVCWRVSVDCEQAEGFLRLACPHLYTRGGD